MTGSCGWVGSILSIDLTDRTISTLPTDQYSERFLGGLGIAEKLYWDESAPELDAFHPDNPLIFMTGPLTATTAPSASRIVACGKSPSIYPEIFSCASLGGFFPAKLKKAGYDGILIKGKADRPVYLYAEDGRVEIRDAGSLWGKGNSAVRDGIRNDHGKQTSIMSIGPGAEHGTRIGSIFTDAGGCGSMGFGSVMGSKNLKAIAVNGSGKIPVADPADITRIRKQLQEMKGEGYYNLFGTPLVLPGIETTIVKKVHCHGCPQGCWRAVHRMPSGMEGIRKCQTPLFYSLYNARFHGRPNEEAFHAADLANEYSFCIVELTFLLIWLDLCVQQGIITEKDIGLDLTKLGSMEFLEDLMQKISFKEGIGAVLSEGVYRASKEFGEKSLMMAEAFLTPAGRAVPYGPKVFTPSALIYATEPRPLITELHEICEPLTKWAIWYTSNDALAKGLPKGDKRADNRGEFEVYDFETDDRGVEGRGDCPYLTTEVLRRIAEKFWGSEKAVDFSTWEGKALAAAKIQNRQYAKESLILCDFAWPVYDNPASQDHVGDPNLESRLLAAVTGMEIDQSGLDHIAQRIFALNRAILLREGRKGKADDVLPEFLFIEREEPPMDVFAMNNPELYLPGAGDAIISRKGKALDKGDFERMKDEYYVIRGWDVKTGYPTKETLKALDLEEVLVDL